MKDFFMDDQNQTFLKNSNTIRRWATPFTLGAFALTALTGILLFFKINLGLIKPAHEWLSWLLVIGTVFHLLVNWRPTVRHFTQPLGRGILFVFFLLICASLLPLDGGGKHHQHSSNLIVEALLQAPLATVAQVAKLNPDETVEILRAQGIYLARSEQTLQEIAEDNNRRAVDILAMIF